MCVRACARVRVCKVRLVSHIAAPMAVRIPLCLRSVCSNNSQLPCYNVVWGALSAQLVLLVGGVTQELPLLYKYSHRVGVKVYDKLTHYYLTDNT